MLREKRHRKKKPRGSRVCKCSLGNKEGMGRKIIRERHKQQGRMTEEREMEAARCQEEQLLITLRWICCGQ